MMESSKVPSQLKGDLTYQLSFAPWISRMSVLAVAAMGLWGTPFYHIMIGLMSGQDSIYVFELGHLRRSRLNKASSDCTLKTCH